MDENIFRYVFEYIIFIYLYIIFIYLGENN